MSNDNNIINGNKNKQFSEIERGKIETYLNEGKNAVYIAEEISRSESAIRDEIKRNRTARYKKSCDTCMNYEKCSSKNLCKNNESELCKGKCKSCGIAIEICKHYEAATLFKCDKFKQKLCCNKCISSSICMKKKRAYYLAEKANAKAEKRKKNSEPPLKISKDKKLLTILDERMSRGISPAVALNTLDMAKYEVSISVATLYSYIDKGVMKTRNIDLRIKPKLKIKREKRVGVLNTHRANGRSIHDRPEVVETRTTIRQMEMDTVEGIKGRALVHTIVERKTCFMFGEKIETKMQVEIKEVLDGMERKLGNYFTELIESITPDNGIEFRDFEAIETSIDNKTKRCSVYYADAYSSYQRAINENMHRLFRYFIPKGKDISKFTKEKIHQIFNQINNYPRKSLNYSTPMKELIKELGDKGVEILKLLGYYVIEIEDLEMKLKKVVA